MDRSANRTAHTELGNPGPDTANACPPSTPPPAATPDPHARTGTRVRRARWFIRPRSLRSKATLIVAIGAAIVLSVMAAGADLQISRIEQDRALGEAQAAASRVSGALRDQPVAMPIRGDPVVNRIQVVDIHGRILASTRAITGLPAISKRVPPATNRVQQYTQCGSPGGDCLAVAAIRVSTAADSPVVYAARPLPAELTSGALEGVLAALALTLTGLIAWSVWCVVGRTLRSVEAIRSRLEEISDADLSLRIPQPSSHDEIARLAATANDTLDRLHDAVYRQRQFTSDAAHELRTPLAALRLHVEEALLFPDADPYCALRDALAGADRLERVLIDMLLLTRLEAGGGVSTERIDLTTLVAAEAARCTELPICTDLEPGVTVSGVRCDLSRLTSNLLDNAERHADTAVDVKLYVQDGEIVLTVADDGPGIPVEERERVFERFTRLDTARSREAGGIGLGLTIAREIATQHRGTLVIEDSPQGACFVLRLPSPGARSSRTPRPEPRRGTGDTSGSEPEADLSPLIPACAGSSHQGRTE